MCVCFVFKAKAICRSHRTEKCSERIHIVLKFGHGTHGVRVVLVVVVHVAVVAVEDERVVGIILANFLHCRYNYK